jgi:hypothetical protein
MPLWGLWHVSLATSIAVNTKDIVMQRLGVGGRENPLLLRPTIPCGLFERFDFLIWSRKWINRDPEIMEFSGN